MSLSLESLTVDHFEPSIGGVFRLETNGTTLDLRLAAVTKLKQGQREGGAFSLLFVSEPGPHLPQAIYALHDPASEPLDIFLVPLGPCEDGNVYEAVFA